MACTFARHGQSEANADGTMQGQADTALSDLGISQANAAAKWLAQGCHQALYCSPLNRARHTAGIIGEHIHHIPVVCADLVEINLGDFTGMRWDAVASKFSKQLGHIPTFWELFSTDQIPRQESFCECLQRANNVFLGLVEAHAGQSFVVVGHKGLFECFIASQCGSNLLQKQIHLDCGGLTTFDYKDGQVTFSTINQIAHLAGLAERLDESNSR